jgi:L-threonylcarbamoyladenylate synthase
MNSSDMVRLHINPDNPSPDLLRQAAETIAGGGVVAFPTDTFYGLAVDPRSAGPVATLYGVKRRAGTQPIPLIAADEDQVLRQVGTMTDAARRLAARFWPGPLTLIIEAAPSLCAAVQDASHRIAVRVPADRVARGLARAAGHPITATSANRSGEPPAATADEVVAALGESVDMVLDAGAVPGGLPSTIVDATGLTPVLVRAGAVAWERVLEFPK